MGNQNAKGNSDSMLSAEEQKVVESTFRFVSGHSEKLSHEKFLISWANIDQHLIKCTANYLYASGQQQTSQQRVASINFKRFAEPYYIVQRGTTDEKLSFIARSIDNIKASQIILKEFEKYITSVVRSYLNIQEHISNQALISWQEHGYMSAERSITAFSKAQVRSLGQDKCPKVDVSELERWLQVNPTFLVIWNIVFSHLYGTHGGKTHKLGNHLEVNILPTNEGIPANTNYTPILDLPHVIFINSNLQNELRHKWRFLFSSKLHGESFSTMLGKILNKGPTLFIVEDEDHFVFAGFAPVSWTLGPKFVGDDSSMLFSLSPAMRCFNATGYNEHFQYLNLNQQTMPNGLGMGGQFNYWGLWLDSEYGLGQSAESCTTYHDYVQLSKRKDFKIKHLEVWGIGDLPTKGEDSDDEEPTNKRSVLDKNLEDRVMLELSGHQIHSDGLRDQDLDL